MIRQDWFSEGATVACIAIAIYLNTFKIGDIALFSMVLALTGWGLSRWVNRHGEDPDAGYDDEWDEEESFGILQATVLALVGIGFGAVLSQIIVGHNAFFAIPASISSLAVTQRKMYGAMMAVAEEQFFRVFATEFAVARLGSQALGIMASGMFGSMMHWARYGTDLNVMSFIFLSFSTLSWVAVRSRRASPPIIAHILHNVWVA